MDIKIFYKLSPSVLEKVIYQADDSLKLMKEKGDEIDDCVQLELEIKFVLIHYLNFNIISGDMVDVAKRYLRKEDLEFFKLNFYNYNKMSLHIK